MIIKGTVLNVIDNSGALTVRCIGMFNKKTAGVGDIITVTIVTAIAGKKVKRKEIFIAVVTTTKKIYYYENGFFHKFPKNTAVLLKKDKTPLGSRINGFVSPLLKKKGFSKIFAISNSI